MANEDKLNSPNGQVSPVGKPMVTYSEGIGYLLKGNYNPELEPWSSLPLFALGKLHHGSLPKFCFCEMRD